MSVPEFQGEFFLQRDLNYFTEYCHRNVTVDAVIGSNWPLPGTESELDIEYIRSMAPDVPLTVINSYAYSLLDWIATVSGMEAPPLVNSVSYGNDEAQQVSAEYMEACNSGFMKAGVRGLSLLFASGDQGVCGREGCGFMGQRFNPDFPSGSPYVTSVGGTDFVGDDIGDEMAWSDGGGGFSDEFPMPEYQKAAVAAYTASPEAELPPQELWNASGRGFPDVSALGGLKAPYCVLHAGFFGGVAGTSASTP